MITIEPATELHARALLRTLRAADRAEISALGHRPGRALMASWRGAFLRRAALVDGQVAAMWGVNGVLFSDAGVPWLLTGEVADQVSPFVIARIYRQQASEMLRLFGRLENFVHATYTGAVRLLLLAGFHLDDPAPLGPRGELFHRFEKRAA